MTGIVRKSSGGDKGVETSDNMVNDHFVLVI